jgi:DNA polymerase
MSIDEVQRALLAWYAMAGVDEAIADGPTDWAAMRSLVAGTDAPSAPRAQPPARPAGPPPAPPAGATAQRGVPARPAPPPWDGPPEPPPIDDFDEPVPDHFRTPGPPQPLRPVAPLRRAPSLPPDAAVMAAREQARAAKSLDELRASLEAFDGCGLKATATKLCFYRGVPQARLMVIGEAPGRDEDLDGKPFVGRAGRLLDKMLAAIGIDESSVHITNIVYWRPPGNRTPTPQEAQVCMPFLARQIELVAPDVILLAGGAAAKQVLDTPEGIMRLRGHWRTYQAGERAVRAMATLHPAYLLRTPAAKRNAWRDLMAVRLALDGKV